VRLGAGVSGACRDRNLGKRGSTRCLSPVWWRSHCSRGICWAAKALRSLGAGAAYCNHSRVGVGEMSALGVGLSLLSLRHLGGGVRRHRTAGLRMRLSACCLGSLATVRVEN
jgi:hypothetical protein